MGRRRTTPELQKLKTFDDSPELTGTKGTSSQKMNGPAKSTNSPRIVTRARGRRALKKDDLIPVPEMNDTPMAIEDELQEDAGVMSPKRFYSKQSKKSAKLADNKQNDVPAVKKRRTVRENKEKSKSGSNNCPEPNLEYNNGFPVILREKSCSKTKMHLNKKNIENKISTSSTSSGPESAPKKENRIRESRIKNKVHMTAEEVITELTNDDKAPNLLSMTEKADRVNSRITHKDVDNNIPVKRSKTVKPAIGAGNKKRKMNLSLADIVNEISPDSPKKKCPESKVISDTSQSAVTLQKGSTKQKPIKRGRPNKVSDDANQLDDEWDHSLLLITDDLNDSGNVYDFEEFQIGTAKTSSDNISSSRKSDKKKSIKKVAAMKAVLSKRKVNKELSTQRKTKKSTTKTSKMKATKKIAQKKVCPTTSENPTIGSATGSAISVENPNSSVDNCGISISANPFQTPSIQMMKEPVSITELEKVKVTKRVENKVISKVNPGLQAILAPDWPQLPDLPSQQFTKLKRGAMEGPTAADNLPENKPKSVMIKTCSAFNQSSLDISSISAESPAKKPLPAKTLSKKIDCLLTEKLSADNQPIDLFTYPVALPIKKKVDGVKKSGKSGEIKQTPVKKLMDFMYAGSVERYLKKPKEDTKLTSPPAVMLPKFLRAETSTPNTMANCPKSLGGESMCISPVKDFLSPASMRTYDHISRRSSASFLAIVKNGDLFTDERKENSLQGKKAEKAKAKKKGFKTNKKFDEWANRMSNEFDEIEHFELSIEN